MACLKVSSYSWSGTCLDWVCRPPLVIVSWCFSDSSVWLLISPRYLSISESSRTEYFASVVTDRIGFIRAKEQ